jgi:hypothetical protein
MFHFHILISHSEQTDENKVLSAPCHGRDFLAVVARNQSWSVNPESLEKTWGIISLFPWKRAAAVRSRRRRPRWVRSHVSQKRALQDSTTTPGKVSGAVDLPINLKGP